MNVKYLSETDFRSFEASTDKKILLNICSDSEYGVTDSNIFWARYYTKPAKEFRKQRVGNIFFTNIFSYHLICNMVCVKWPKSFYNMKPFKLNSFNDCCKKCNDFMKKNDFNTIFTPVFGTEILEGNWTEILQTMNNNFKDMFLYIFR